jgi:predicted amidophosphoribosyltransferase
MTDDMPVLCVDGCGRDALLGKAICDQCLRRRQAQVAYARRPAIRPTHFFDPAPNPDPTPFVAPGGSQTAKTSGLVSCDQCSADAEPGYRLCRSCLGIAAPSRRSFIDLSQPGDP